MSHLITSPFPHLKIRRVLIDHDEITIDAFLTIHADDSEENWLTEDLFSEYVKIYFFIIAGDSSDIATDELASLLAAPEHRVTNIVEQYNYQGPSQDPEEWWRVFKRSKDASTGEILNDHVFKQISFAEAVQISYENNLTTSELDRGLSSLRDINFSVKITDENNYNLNKILTNDNVTGLKLYALTHLDVASMISDFSLIDDPASLREMLRIGGNLAAETLLTRNDENVLEPPDTYQMLTYEDGTPYSGVYHIHTAQNPGPAGYIGYMEGPKTPMHPDARRLFVREYPYSKIIANFILDDLSDLNPFNGSAELEEALDYNYVTPHTETRNKFMQLYANTNLYTNQLKTPTSMPITNMSAINSMKDINLSLIYGNESIENLRKRHFDFLNERRDFSIITDSLDYIEYTEESDLAHVVEFNLDFEKLVRSKSKYAFLIDNIVSSQASRNAADSELRVLLYEVLNLVKIKNLEISRFRLSNSPRSNNPVCSADFDSFDNNQLERLLIKTYEPDDTNRVFSMISDDFLPNRSSVAIFEEEPRVSGFNTRSFKLRDQELAQAINYGHYAYKIKIHLEDGIKSMLFDIAQNIHEKHSRYLEFISSVHGGFYVPFYALEGQAVELAGRVTFERRYARGEDDFEPYYDESTEKYSEKFKALFEFEYKADVSDLISKFIDLQVLLGVMPKEAEKSLRKALVLAIYPANGNLESAIYFSKLVEDSLDSLMKILQRDTVSSSSNGSYDYSGNSFNKFASSAPQNAKISTVIFEKRIPGSVKTFVNGEVMYSYGIESLEQMVPLSANLTPEAATPTAIPVSIDVFSEERGIINILDTGRYLELPVLERQTVDANIRVIENTPPSETLNQADRDLPINEDDIFEPEIIIPGCTFPDPALPTNPVNDLLATAGIGDVLSGMPKFGTQGVAKALLPEDFDITGDLALIAELGMEINEKAAGVRTDLRDELLAADPSPSSPNLVVDGISAEGVKPPSGNAFGSQSASPQILIPGSSPAKFADLNDENISTAQSSNPIGTVKIKVAGTSGVSANNVVTVDAQTAKNFMVDSVNVSVTTTNSSNMSAASGYRRYF